MFSTDKEKSKGTSINFKIKSGNIDLEFSGDNLSGRTMDDIVRGILIPNFSQNYEPESVRIMEEQQQAAVDNPNANFDRNLSLLEETAKRVEDKITPEVVKPKPPISRKLPIAGMLEGSEKVYSSQDDDETMTAFAGIANLFPQELLDKEVKLGEKTFDSPVLPVKEAEREPDFYNTGIKYKGVNGDIPNYKVGYSCPKCGDRGRHYVRENNKMVPCHNCNSKLRVEPATVNGFGVGDKYRDAYGNFFVAKVLVVDNYPSYQKE